MQYLDIFTIFQAFSKSHLLILSEKKLHLNFESAIIYTPLIASSYKVKPAMLLSSQLTLYFASFIPFPLQDLNSVQAL